MVETRNQKRKNIEYDNDNNNNIFLIKKKKIKTESEYEYIDEPKSESNESENNESSESESNENESESNENEIDIKKEISNVLSSSLKIYNQFKNFINNKKKNKNYIDYETDDETDRDYNPHIDKFNELIETIFTGEFFEKKDFTKQNLDLNEINFFNKELLEIQDYYRNRPNVIDILKLKIPIDKKRDLLEAISHLENCDVLSQEYNNNLLYIENAIKEVNRDPELVKLEAVIQQKALSCKQDSYKTKILKSGMSLDNKIIAYQKLEIMESYEHSHSDEFIKYKNWMDTLLSIPFNCYNNIPVNINSHKSDLQKFLLLIRNTLDSQLSFLEKPKDQIINIVSQMIRNPDCNINAIGLWGSKGVGKTKICESISKALNRPLRTISLGGESDSSNLTGHNFTYVGSQPGRFVDILKETQTMNPIFLIDELDKVSVTEKGNEIIGTLIHLTDSSTNSKYNLDKYYSGIEFDLSKALFIFTYNDPSKIDKILSDRLFKIKVDNYNFKEKLEIANKHLINTILCKLNLNTDQNTDQIQFSQEAISYLVRSSENDQGMRGIKTKIEIVLTRINMLLLTNPLDNIIKLKYKKLYKDYTDLPVIIPKEHIDIFLDESISSDDFNKPPPFMYI